jgi:hypothetical protein
MAGCELLLLAVLLLVGRWDAVHTGGITPQRVNPWHGHRRCTLLHTERSVYHSTA